MSSWINTFSAATRQINSVWDSLKYAAESKLGVADPIMILPYRGYGTPQQIYLKGRVLQDEGIKLREEDASLLKNVCNMYRRFEEVPEFYQALQQGASGNEGNPIFYVSSSAWNMYDRFAKFMEINNIPLGPMLLRDIELSLDNLLAFEHESHKREQIEPILERFPNLPFMLIGDGGQQDAEIYTQLVKAYPGRIRAIYIRAVVPDNAQQQQILADFKNSIAEQNVPLVVFDKTQAASVHAVRQGWIQA